MLAIKAFSMAHWNLQDDQGLLHHIEIHDAAWVMDLPHTLLSLQTLDLTNKQSLSISSWCMHAAVVKQMQIFLNRGICQNNPTGSQKRYPLFVFDVRHGKNLVPWQKISKQIQTSNCHWASHLCKHCIGLRSQNDDSPPFSMPPSPTIGEQLLFTCDNNAKQCGESKAKFLSIIQRQTTRLLPAWTLLSGIVALVLLTQSSKF